MSATWQTVTWNRNKYVYDAVLVVAVGLYLLMFFRLYPLLADYDLPIDRPTLRIRAFGSCTFLMLTLVLCIGPLARLDRRFLPLLYNRRHFGVILFTVALSHLLAVKGWYHAFSPTDPWVSILWSNPAYGSFLGFPFEILGLLAIAILFVMAATSHDFWLHFLGAPLWKALHMGVYLAYGLVVMHVSLGALQNRPSLAYPVAVALSLTLVIGLHLAAAAKGRREDEALPRLKAAGEGWVEAGRVDEVPLNRAITLDLADGKRVAIFRHEGGFSAVSNACAHQNGPLGEGRVLGGCITCPWHGFQYDPATGRAPPPFTEKIPTYRIRLEGQRILIHPQALPPGTYVEPARPAEETP